MSPALVRRNLAQYLVLLFLNLEKNHNSNVAQTYLESDQDELLKILQFSIRIPAIPKRTKSDESQITFLVRALLELSGGRVDCRQHGFAEEYTASQNADLFASVFEVTRKNRFGYFDSEEMCKLVSKSPVFSEVAISQQDLESWTTSMRDFLRIGFSDRYLVRHSKGRSNFILT